MSKKEAEKEIEFVYVQNKDKETGKHRIYKLSPDGEKELVEGEPPHDYNADAYARAQQLNRGIGVYESAAADHFRYKAHLQKCYRERRLKEEEEERQRRAAREAEEERRRQEVLRGSPHPRSPAEVAVDSAYERVHEADGGTWPATVQLVVRHKPTGGLWSCRYRIREDDSDGDSPANWHAVEAVSVTTTRYMTPEERQAWECMSQGKQT